MKPLHKTIPTLLLAAAGFLASCSKQTTSVMRADKLANVQSLDNGKTAANAQIAQKDNPNTALPTPIATNPTATVTCPRPSESPTATTPMVHKPIAANMHRALSAQTLFPKMEQKILKKTASLERAAVAKNTAAYRKANHAEGLLGFAVACLVIGLVLLFLGFEALGSLFWTIGVVVLVIALVFFIFWIIGMAAAS